MSKDRTIELTADNGRQTYAADHVAIVKQLSSNPLAVTIVMSNGSTQKLDFATREEADAFYVCLTKAMGAPRCPIS